MLKRTVAIIPAKGRSRRIPRKNMVDFAGKPLLSYSIITALHVPEIDAVYVSTDDEEIAEHSRSLGATVPFMRDSKLSGETVHGTEPVLDMLEKLEDLGDENLYCIRLLTPYPFLKTETVSKIIKRSQEEHRNVISVRSLGINVHHLKVFNGNNEILPATGEDRKNFQIDAAPELYALSGAAQCAPAQTLMKERSYHYNKPLGHVLSKIEAIEVDTLEDLELARKLMTII